MQSIRGRGRILQRHRTVDNLRRGWDGHGPSLQKRNSQLFSWDDEFWKESAKGHSIASSASTFEEVESLCLSKSSSDSMCSSLRQLDKSGSGPAFKGTHPSRRLISRQSSTTSSATSRSSCLMGDTSGDSAADFNAGTCQFIADTLLESIDFLGAQGSLDMADRYYLEKIFQRVLEWNTGVPASTSKTAVAGNAQSRESKHRRHIVTRQELHHDANSPRSYAVLRQKLEHLKHSQQLVHGQLNTHPEKRRRKDFIPSEEEEAVMGTRNHSHQLRTSRTRDEVRRDKSYSSRDTSVSSRDNSYSAKAFSNNSTSKCSNASSMSSFSMDNNSTRDSFQTTTQTQHTSHADLATCTSQYSLPHTGSFESTASPPDQYMLSQSYASSAERVLMGLGFGAAEGVLPERFLKDWYSKIMKAQMGSALNTELQRQESVNNQTTGVAKPLSTNVGLFHNNGNIHNMQQSGKLHDSFLSSQLHEASTDLPNVNDHCSKLERLKDYIAAYSNNNSSTDKDKQMVLTQHYLSRQKSLPLGLEAFNKTEANPRIYGIDPCDKETRLQMFISDTVPSNRSNLGYEHPSSGQHTEGLAVGHSSGKLKVNCLEHPRNQTSQNNSTVQSNVQQVIHTQLLANDLPEGPQESNTDWEMQDKQSRLRVIANKQEDRINCRSPQHVLAGVRAARSPTRQVAIDVCEPVWKADSGSTHLHTATKAYNHTENRKGQMIQDNHQKAPYKIESVMSKESEEVANIMQNSPGRENYLSSTDQHKDKIYGNRVKPLKSALKHVEPAMVSIVLEDTDQGEGRCNPDILSVSQEGIHLVIPLSACNAASLSPIPQSPVTVIEVGLDNQQDSLDTEGTVSSKDTDDDMANNSVTFLSEDYNTLKPNHDRRRSLSNLSLKPDKPPRRRSTGFISPIPCQFSLINVPSGSKSNGQQSRRLSLEVPVASEIRHFLQKQKALQGNYSHESLEETKKARGKRRASFSEAEPIIINDVLARQRSHSMREGDTRVSDLDSFRKQHLLSSTCLGDSTHNAESINPNNLRNKKSRCESSGHDNNQNTPTSDQHLKQCNEYKEDTWINEQFVKQKTKNTQLQSVDLPELELTHNTSAKFAPLSSKSAFTVASKRTNDNSPSAGNGYFSETDAEEFPNSVHPNLQPRSISSIAKCLETDNYSSDRGCDNKLSAYGPTYPAIVNFPDINNSSNIQGNILNARVKAQMISRAVEANIAQYPYPIVDAQVEKSCLNSSDYYYASDKGTQCSVISFGRATQSDMMQRLISKYTQTGIDRYEVSTQTTNLFYLVHSSRSIPTKRVKSESKAINTAVCLIGRDHNNTSYLTRPSSNTVANYSNIDEAIREIDAELCNIDIRNYQRSLGAKTVQSSEYSYPVLSRQKYRECTCHTEAASYYGIRDYRLVGQREHFERGLQKYAPSNWRDATELVITSHVSDNSSKAASGTLDYSETQRTIIVNNRGKADISPTGSIFYIPSTYCSDNVYSGRSARYEESKEVRNLQNIEAHDSRQLVDFNYNRKHNNCYNPVASSQQSIIKQQQIGWRSNQNMTISRELNSPSARTDICLGTGETKDGKVNNEPPVTDNATEKAASDNNDANAKVFKVNCSRIVDAQSAAGTQEYKQTEGAALIPDLNPSRKSSTTRKLLKTKHMARVNSNECTPFLTSSATKEQADKGHSKLSRLKYNQSSHRSSGSSFDIELDFLNAGEPIGTVKGAESTTQGFPDCKYRAKKQMDVNDLLQSIEMHTVTKHSDSASEGNTTDVADSWRPTNELNMLKIEEQSGHKLNSTAAENILHVDNFKSERLAHNIDSKARGNITINRNETVDQLLVAADVVNNKNQCILNVTRLNVDNWNSRKSSLENIALPTTSNYPDSLQVPGSPDHLLNKARFLSCPGNSFPSTESLTSSNTHVQKFNTIEIKNTETVTQTATNSNSVRNALQMLDVPSADKQSEYIRDISNGNRFSRNISISSTKLLAPCIPSQPSSHKLRDASMHRVRSNGSMLDHRRIANVDVSTQDSHNRDIDVDRVGIVIAKTRVAPFLGLDVFQTSNGLKRHQSVSDCSGTADEQERDELDSNLSVLGSELNLDTDDTDIMTGEPRQSRLNSDSSYSQPFLDLTDSLSENSDSNKDIKTDECKALLTAGYNIDDLLQVSDFGSFSPASFLSNSHSGENHSLSPSNSIRSHEKQRHSPAYRGGKSPSRELPHQAARYSDSDDDLDSETELKIRDQLRQVRRESRRLSKDNGDAIQAVLILPSKKPSDSVSSNQEDASYNIDSTSDNVTSPTKHVVAAPSQVIVCLVDDSFSDQCDQDITRTNTTRPVMRKLIKMSSDPVDKEMYCRSFPLDLAKEKSTHRMQSKPVAEETTTDVVSRDDASSVTVHTQGNCLGMGTVSEDKNKSTVGTNEAFQSEYLKVLGNYPFECREADIPEKIEESYSQLINHSDAQANLATSCDTSNAARILEVEFSNDDADKDTPFHSDEQDTSREPSSNILDELEIIALFQKIDGVDGSVNPCVEYSSDSSSSVECKLPHISEEETQSDDNTGEEGRRQFWQVRSRFVLPQDTQESLLDGITRQDSLSSRSSGHSEHGELLPDMDATLDYGKQTIRSCQNPCANEGTITYSEDKRQTFDDERSNIEPSNRNKAEIRATSFTPCPNALVLSHYDQQNFVKDSKRTVTVCPRSSPDIFSKSTTMWTPEYNSALLGLLPKENMVSAYDTHIAQCQTDVTEKLSKERVNARIVKVANLTSSYNGCSKINSRCEMSKDNSNTATTNITVKDHRRCEEAFGNNNQLFLDQSEVQSQTNLSVVETQISLPKIGHIVDMSVVQSHASMSAIESQGNTSSFENQFNISTGDNMSAIERNDKIRNIKSHGNMSKTESQGITSAVASHDNMPTIESSAASRTVVTQETVSTVESLASLPTVASQASVPTDRSHANMSTVESQANLPTLESNANMPTDRSQVNMSTVGSHASLSASENLATVPTVACTDNMPTDSSQLNLAAAECNANLPVFSKGKYETLTQASVREHRMFDLCEDTRVCKVQGDTNERDNTLQTHENNDINCDTKVKKEENGIDNSQPVVNDSSSFDLFFNSRTPLSDTLNLEPVLTARSNLKIKVRPMFRIDTVCTPKDVEENTNINGESYTNSTNQGNVKAREQSKFATQVMVTSRDIVPDNNINISSSILMQTQGDFTDKTLVLCETDRVSTFTSITVNSNNDETCLVKTRGDYEEKADDILIIDRVSSSEDIKYTNNASYLDGTQEDVKNKKKSDTETTPSDVPANTMCQHNNDSQVNDGNLIGGQDNTPLATTSRRRVKASWNTTETDNTEDATLRSISSRDISQTVLSTFFSDTVDSEDSFGVSSEFTEKDYRSDDFTTNDISKHRENLMLSTDSAFSEVICTESTNHQNVNCCTSSPQVNMEIITPLLVSNDDAQPENMFNESTEVVTGSDSKVNIMYNNTRITSSEILGASDNIYDSKYESCQFFSVKDTMHESVNIEVPRSSDDISSPCDGKLSEEQHIIILTSDAKGDSFNNSQLKPINDADSVEEAKRRVRTMFLLGSQHDSDSSETTSSGSQTSSKESLPLFPLKSIGCPTGNYSEKRKSPEPLCITSSSAASAGGHAEELNNEIMFPQNDITADMCIQPDSIESKDISTDVNKTFNKNSRFVKFRRSLLKLHEQMKVFSSMGSDSDTELMSALKNQGDYDIRMRDLALGRLSSDNNDEDAAVISTNIIHSPNQEMTDDENRYVLSQGESSAENNLQCYAEDTRPSASVDLHAALMFPDSCVDDPLSKDNILLMPKLMVQQPSEEQLAPSLKKSNFTAATIMRVSNTNSPLLSEHGCNADKENVSNSGKMRHFTQRYSFRPQFSSPWLRNNPHANFLTPDRALTHSPHCNHVTNEGQYQKGSDDSHPELLYLDIVSKLQEQEFYKTRPAKQHGVDFVISPPDTTHKHSGKTVRFQISDKKK